MRPKNLLENYDIRFNEHDIWVVVEKYNATKRDDDYRYAGAPCTSYGEAVDLMYSHVGYDSVVTLCKVVKDGSYFDETNPETGEIIKEYIIKKIGKM